MVWVMCSTKISYPKLSLSNRESKTELVEAPSRSRVPVFLPRRRAPRSPEAPPTGLPGRAPLSAGLPRRAASDHRAPCTRRLACSSSSPETRLAGPPRSLLRTRPHSLPRPALRKKMLPDQAEEEERGTTEGRKRHRQIFVSVEIEDAYLGTGCAAMQNAYSDWVVRWSPVHAAAQFALAMDSGSREIAFDCSSFRLYMDGQVERNPQRMETVPAGFDADTGVTSKDVVIDAATGATVRLYLPPVQAATTKLPILVFFHGGYFIVGSAAEPMYHRYVNLLVARARAVAVSVNYRLTPEHPLPAAYDDSWAALEWAVSGADPWLSDHGDLGRVFIVGVSAGGNIAHNMAISVGVNGLPPADVPPRIEAVLLFHPSFSGEQKMEEEDGEFFRANNNRWAVIFPGARGGADDPRINPMAAGAPSLAKLAGERLLLCTGSLDPRAPRGPAYCEAVRASGWSGKVEWFESEGEGHGFFVLNPGSRKAVELMDRVAAFLAEQ